MSTKLTKVLSLMLAVMTLMCIVPVGTAYAATPTKASNLLSGDLDGELNPNAGVLNPVAEANGVSSSDEEKIWYFLSGKTNNAYGAAGIMGNLYAESALISNNLQNSYESSLGFMDDADASYTAAVDNGTYTNFVHDSAGYGLAQWTYYSRKQNLLNYAKKNGKSIGNLDMQLNFLWKELTESYSSLVNTLKNAKSVKEASDAVLTQFEKPADMGDAVKTIRAGYGQTYYNKYAQTSAPTLNFSTSFRGIYTTKGVSNYLTIRSNPGASYSEVGRIKAGEYFEITKATSGKTVNDWGYVKFKGKTGYVCMYYTQMVADVKPSDYYYNAVLWAYNNGITNGTNATHFSPDATCTRAQIVTFLYKAFGSPEPGMLFEDCNFVDVQADAYYAKAVLWAVENNITNGTDATHFSPGTACNRGQIVTFLWAAFGRPAVPEATNNPFTDVKSNKFYYKPVLWAYNNGITNGTSATTFSPDNSCTRAQSMTFIYRAFTVLFPQIPENKYCSFYSGNRINKIYKDSALTQQNAGWEIYAYEDECYIYEIDMQHSSLKVSYPAGNSRKVGWVSMDDVFGYHAPFERITAKASATTYQTRNGATYGNVAKNDTIYAMRVDNGHVLIIYDVDNSSTPNCAYKLAWVKGTDYKKIGGTTVPAPIIPNIVDVALTELKFANQNIGGMKYITWYNSRFNLDCHLGTAWCAIFVSWCADQCELSSDRFVYSANCADIYKKYNNRGQWVDRDDAGTPQPGWIILFDKPRTGTDYIDHVGIVQKVENGYVYTIEGNTSGSPSANGKVDTHQYPLTDARILGYGKPNY